MFLKYNLLDFETASACDLKKAGAWRYAEDPTTEIICLAFSSAPGEVPLVWTPWLGPDHPITRKLRALAEDPMVMFIAHNAQFEKAIWRRIMVEVFGFPDIPDERWHDSMAVCAMKGLPQQLERAALVLHSPIEKDMEGSKITVGLSRIDKKTGYYDRGPDLLERTYSYCAQDVMAEWGVHERVGWFQPGERSVWLLDQKINERGIKLDIDYIRACQTIVDKASIPLAKEFAEITGGLKMTQVAKFQAWLHGQNVHLDNLRKETLADALGDDDDGVFGQEEEGGEDTSLPARPARALRIRQLIGSSAVKKLPAMEQCICYDGRAHGLLQYHGAGPGRWAGRLLQPQNFPRGSVKLDDKPVPVDLIVEAIMSGDPEYVAALIGPAVETVVSGLRHCLIADKGKVFVSGDYTQIELRVLLALAGQDDKLAILTAGGTPYQDMAQQIFGRPIDKHNDIAEYTLGKNTVLGCGFQMGAAKFQLRYAKDRSLEFCQNVINIYRHDWAPRVPKLWWGLEAAATRTVHEGTPHEAYGVEYQLEDGWLTARLPSGRKLWYRNPQAVRKAMPWDETDVRPAYTYQAQKQGRWITVEAFGGLATENVVQGLARDVLVCAMKLAEKEGYPTVLTVHDEDLTEVEDYLADEKALQEIMMFGAPWIKELGIPLAVETWMGDRYRK